MHSPCCPVQHHRLAVLAAESSRRGLDLGPIIYGVGVSLAADPRPVYLDPDCLVELAVAFQIREGNKPLRPAQGIHLPLGAALQLAGQFFDHLFAGPTPRSLPAHPIVGTTIAPVPPQKIYSPYATRAANTVGLALGGIGYPSLQNPASRLDDLSPGRRAGSQGQGRHRCHQYGKSHGHLLSKTVRAWAGGRTGGRPATAILN